MAGKKLASVKLSDIYKRVPSNQFKQFRDFKDKNTEYKRRVEKFPEFLPKIDWAYYRVNVRTEYIKLVDEFEKKYVEMNKAFNNRQDLDTSKYYVELEKMREEVKIDVEKFIAESNKRIKRYNDEIARINSMIAYDQMTMEDYVDTHKHPLFTADGQPTFWPHTPEEQRPGPSVTDEDRRRAIEAALNAQEEELKAITTKNPAATGKAAKQVKSDEKKPAESPPKETKK